ncbi:SGNH/GDSL hydrolase family protein [Verrucomicrobiota bacterium]
MKIFVIGDSISIGYGPFLKQYLDGAITYSRKEGEAEALLNLDKPVGANGGDSSRVLEFLKASANTKSIKADLLLVNCGLHDIRKDPETGQVQVAIEAYKQNLLSIVSVAKDLQTTLVWIRTTPCDEKIHNKPGMKFHRFAADCAAYNAVADRIMNEAKVPMIDLFTFTKNLGPDIFRDHVHFHEHIRQKQAAFIAGWLDCWKRKN